MPTDTPPTQQPAGFDPNNPDLFIDRPKWPTVIGVISVSWAGLGLLCGVLGTVGFVFMRQPMFTEQMEKSMGSPMPDVMLPNTMQLVLMGVGTLWACVLLFAGIALVTRKQTGRMLHLLYAIVALALACAGLFLQARQMSALHAWVEANPGNKWAQTQSPVGQFLGACFGMIMSLGYPTFLILWFGLGKGRQKIS